MLLRRQLPLAAATALALACAPSVPYSPPPASVTYAVFNLTSNPATTDIPQPNDITLDATEPDGGLVIDELPPSAQQDLLLAWAMQGGFPNDQEVDITIDFQTQNIDPNTGAITNSAPALDLTTITPQTLVIFELPGSSVTYAPITAANYVTYADHGTLTVKNLQGGLVGAPWAAGVHYAVALEGGPNGIKTTDGVGINPSPIFYLLTRGVNLSLPENETLLPGDRADRLSEGATLEQVRQNYLEPFTQVSSYFPSTDLAVMATFQIAPTSSAYVQTDPNRGLIPLPSDFLLNAAGTLVQDVPAFGPLAGGISTLDGFSTTGMILSTTSAPILASTVNKNTVFLYDLSNPTAPVRVPDGTEAGGGYESEPAALEETVAVGAQQVAVSTAIGLQPAVPLASGATLPPLKENTEYAVLISNGVKDLNQAGLSRSTLAQLLLFAPDHPVASSGTSLVQGVSDSEAVVIEAMREKLAPAIAQLAIDKSIPSSDLSMAYTFRTQSITGQGNFEDQLAGVPLASRRPDGLLQFAAIPYESLALATTIGTSLTVNHVYSAAEAFTKYGIDQTVVPSSNIAEVLDGTVITPEILDPTTGAFSATLAASPNQVTIPALIVVPNAANVSGGSAPLVVFHHGLTSDRAAMLVVADALAAKGFVVAAIDGDKHGARSWCNADSQCARADGSLTGSVVAGSCVAIPGGAGQGDAVPPGTCSNGPLVVPELCSSNACLGEWANWNASHQASGSTPADFAGGHALISGQYFVSANFFRTRDTLRQDVIDQAALMLALAGAPGNVNPELVPLNAALQSAGFLLDPNRIYWEGQSLGAILGTLNAAANPRLSNVALNVGGGTLTDIITNAPAFASSIGGLLQSVGITPGTAGYLQFLILAKWILDPADPINVAKNLKTSPLPDLLNPPTQANPNINYQSAKNVLGQMAECDQTVPNPFNLELYGNIGLDLANLAAPVASGSNLTLFGDAAAGSGSCPSGADGLAVPSASDQATLPHAFITTWGISEGFNPATGAFTFSTDANVGALTGIAQSEAAAFLASPTTNLPPSIVLYPSPQ